MTDKNTSNKYSRQYKLSISNPRFFDAIKMAIAILIALAITFVILCLISKDPVNALKTILFGPLSKKRYIGAVIEGFISFAFAGLAAGVLFKAGGFNLGAEGIFIITGAVVAWIASSPITTSPILHPILCYLGAMVDTTYSDLLTVFYFDRDWFCKRFIVAEDDILAVDDDTSGSAGFPESEIRNE